MSLAALPLLKKKTVVLLYRHIFDAFRTNLGGKSIFVS